MAKVSVVGAGMINNPGVAARMFEALYDAGVNINMISTSEIRFPFWWTRRMGTGRSRPSTTNFSGYKSTADRASGGMQKAWPPEVFIFHLILL